MYKILARLLFFIGVVPLYLGCDDSSSNTPEESLDTSPFVISSLSTDSVYWGEWVSITGSGFGTDSTALKLFLYFSDLEFSLMTPKTIFFQVPQGAETGKLRLYRGDSLAEGSLTLHVLPRQINGFSPTVTHFAPTIASKGSLITIYGSSLPMRPRDYALTLGNQPLPIDSFTNINLFSHLPEGAQSGELTVSLMGRVFGLGRLTVEN